MENYIVQLITAFLGSTGFAMLFHLRGRLVLPAGIGGLFCWGTYLLAEHFLGGLFIPSVVGSAFAALYAELLARIMKAPATIFFVPTVISMIPGSTLYYTMSYAVRKDWEQAHIYGSNTLQYALGIAVGICLVWAFVTMKGYVMAAIRAGREKKVSQN